MMNLHFSMTNSEYLLSLLDRIIAESEYDEVSDTHTFGFSPIVFDNLRVRWDELKRQQ